MEFNEIKELVELFSKCNIDQLSIEREGLNLRLGKKKDKITIASNGQTSTSSTPQFALAPAGPTDTEEHEDADLVYVTSPIVGTFYQAPNPSSPPFVRVGDSIHKGQTMCIVEAMKLMNEIQADQDGAIVKILVENGQGVEFGQRLFALRS